MVGSCIANCNTITLVSLTAQSVLLTRTMDTGRGAHMHQGWVSQKRRRSFCYASVYRSSLTRSALRNPISFVAEYSPLISVAYTWLHNNREGHQLATDIKWRDDEPQQSAKAKERASARTAGTDARALRRWPRPALGRVGSLARPSCRARSVRGADEGTPHDALLMSQENAS